MYNVTNHWYCNQLLLSIDWHVIRSHEYCDWFSNQLQYSAGNFNFNIYSNLPGELPSELWKLRSSICDFQTSQVVQKGRVLMVWPVWMFQPQEPGSHADHVQQVTMETEPRVFQLDNPWVLPWRSLHKALLPELYTYQGYWSKWTILSKNKRNWSFYS